MEVVIMSKKFAAFTCIISFIAVCLAGFNCYMLVKESGDVQYIIYLGTNDKDSNNPVFTHDEAKNKLDEILTKYFDGFTITEALGGWKDENGQIFHEYTLVIYLSDTNIKQVHAASDELIKEFNQSSVLIHTNRTRTEFYSFSGE